ncbi:EamA family transporter, partial [Pseudomonas helleri]|uniref:EamA family transporter n=1 Tax=Pseudomonas helleri TaxID=1608996 RepID=UPI001E2903CB
TARPDERGIGGRMLVGWVAGWRGMRTLIPIALAVALLSTALPYTLEMIALTRMPTRTFGTLMSIEPAFGALSGLLFLHEVLSVTQWIAILCIIMASVGATLTMRGHSTRVSTDN